MREMSRRDMVKAGAALAASAAGGGLLRPATASVPAYKVVPEQNAALRVLRWREFVQGDIDTWMANSKRFSETTGIPVRVDTESWEDVRPQAVAAAKSDGGPDIVIGTFDDPQEFPDKLLDLTELADYLGAKYGGWYRVAKIYGTDSGGRWIALPQGAATGCINYRMQWVEEAGYGDIPKDSAGFLKLCQALKAKGHPPGLALGHATGDANGWTHWCLWAHGGKLVDKDGHVTVRSNETLAALEYAKELYETFIPGTLTWLDTSNNKAFLEGEISLTQNGISIYYAAKNSTDPALRAMAKDINHANMPIGPVGKPTEINLVLNAFVFRYCQYPKAATEYLRFMWEKEQYIPWQAASLGYIAQPLAAYEKNPIWIADAKITPFRDGMKHMLWNGYAGKLGPASAAAMADFVVVDMFAAAASGQKTPQAAMEAAEARTLRYYKV